MKDKFEHQENAIEFKYETLTVFNVFNTSNHFVQIQLKSSIF